MNLLPAILLLGASLLVAEDVKPNPIIEKVLANDVTQAIKAHDVYMATLSKISAQAVKDLDKAKQDAMKKGDLTTALAIDTLSKDFNAAKLASMVDTQEKNMPDLLGDAPADPAKAIVGKWAVKYDAGFTSTLIVKADGTAQSNITWKWNIKGTTLTFIGDNREVDTFKLPITDHMVAVSVIGAGDGGHGLELTRIIDSK
jgi:hypothetical protein